MSVALLTRTQSTEEAVPRRLGPKRATRIRKLFALDKADKMEKQYRLKREVSRGEGKKPTIKMPKIQRLVTPQRLQVLCLLLAGIISKRDGLYVDVSDIAKPTLRRVLLDEETRPFLSWPIRRSEKK